jgi:hypothetical protein
MSVSPSKTTTQYPDSTCGVDAVDASQHASTAQPYSSQGDRAIAYAGRLYNRFISSFKSHTDVGNDGETPGTTQMVIPICEIRSVVQHGRKRRLVDSQDVVHPNICIFNGSQSKRLRPVQPQDVGTTKGRFPMILAYTIESITGIAPDIILFWPVWEIKVQFRGLRGLMIARDSKHVHAMQLSYGLAKWAKNHLLWVFLPFDSLTQFCREDGVVVFDTTIGPVADTETANAEQAIWEQPGIRVVLYKTTDTIENHKLEENKMRPTKDYLPAMDSRPEQVLLKSWMNQAAIRQKDILSSLPLQPSVIPSEYVFDPCTILTPDKDLKVSVNFLGRRPTVTYIVPRQQVFVLGLSV